MNKFFTIVIVILNLSSCDLRNHGTNICTEMFAAVTVEITGKVLTDFYTVRISTNETIRYETMFGDSIYTVLDDSYVSELRNQQDTFVFYGYYRGELVVEEAYVIEADECHVEKVSGKATVEL